VRRAPLDPRSCSHHFLPSHRSLAPPASACPLDACSGLAPGYENAKPLCRYHLRPPAPPPSQLLLVLLLLQKGCGAARVGQAAPQLAQGQAQGPAQLRQAGPWACPWPAWGQSQQVVRSQVQSRSPCRKGPAGSTAGDRAPDLGPCFSRRGPMFSKQEAVASGQGAVAYGWFHRGGVCSCRVLLVEGAQEGGLTMYFW